MLGRADPQKRLPPLWLASSAVTAAIAVVFGVARWVDHFRTDPYAEDMRIWIVAARIGLQHGWSHIYDLDLQRAASAGFGPVGRVINPDHAFIAPPPGAWLMVPLAWLPVPAAFVVWTLIGLGAFAGAAWVVFTGPRFLRLTALLVSLALWPVHYQFWLGQWVAVTVALLALCWWLLERERWAAAGGVLAIAFVLKPQDVLLLPVAMLVSGRWRPAIAFAVTGAVLGALSAAAIGPNGITEWLHDLAWARADPAHWPLTYGYAFGPGPVATALEACLGVGALGLAWYRRERLDIVFALGLVGTTASASYLHEYDVAVLVLPAWLLLRAGGASWPQKVWLLAGIAAAQFIAIGMPIPMLLWEPGWIVLLGLEPRLRGLETRSETPLRGVILARPEARQERFEMITAYDISRIVLEQSMRARVGHIGSSLSISGVLAALYGGTLRAKGPEDPDRDRFLLSKGHAALALYAALHLRGWISSDDLNTYCAEGTLLGVHPDSELPGVDFSSGSLGHGLSIGAGAALAARMQRSKRRVFVLLSDAECNEGSLWEAVMFAAHHRLSNLFAIVDGNGQQALGYTRDVLSLDRLIDRWKAFGWDAVEVDGHDVPQLVRTIDSLAAHEDRPHVLIAKTVFGHGVSFMESQIKWHYLPMTQPEYDQAQQEIERLR